MALSKTFCPAPFMQLEVSKDGLYGPCCFTSSVWTQKNTSIKEKWNSDEINSLRKNLLDGKKDKTCSRCWNEEKANKQSLRMRMLNFKGSSNTEEKLFKKLVENKTYKTYPKVLQLTPGNECNLACPSCMPALSSKWNSLVNQKDYGTFQKTTKNWNLTKEQYQDIVDNSDKLQKIELFGGEPFLNKQNEINLLDKLIEKGTSKNIKLYFNTNGTIFNEKLLDKLTKNFKFLEIRLSIDGTGSQFEYLRYGANFDQVVENAQKFYKLDNSDFECICTVSIFNVMYLDKYDDFFKKMNWSVFYNIAHYPSNLQIFNIPEQVKKSISLSKKFNDVIEYINNKKCNDVDWQRFVKYTKILDKNRNLSFKNTFPEFYELVRAHGFST